MIRKDAGPEKVSQESAAAIGARLKAMRQERTWTARKMAEKLRAAADNPNDIPHVESLVRMVRRWEAGQQWPSELYRLLYCKIFGMSEPDLFDSIESEDGEAGKTNPERTSRPTLLRVLLGQRHWRVFRTFEAQFCRAARELAKREEEPSLAKLTVSERTFERWVSGTVKTMPSSDASRVLEYMFDVPVHELLRPVDVTITRKDASPADVSQESVTSASTTPDIVTASIAPVSGLVHKSTADATRIVMSAGVKLVDPITIEQLFEEIRRLSVLYNTSTAGFDRMVFEEATRFRGGLQDLITAYRNPSQLSDLYLMTGMLSGLCSYACLDLGYPAEAMAQVRATFIMGDLAGHNGLRAWALGTSSLISRFQGRYDEALSYARQGLQYATDGTALVRLRSGEGQTLANMGDTAGAIHSLNLAKEAREHVNSIDITEGMFSFSEAKQMYYSGSSLQWLPGEKNARAAEAESMRAIQMFQADGEHRALGDELLAHIYLGNSRLTLGEIEGSMAALRPVLDLPEPERNAWQRKRMREVARKLGTASFSDSRVAISARDEITTFTETRP